MTATPSANVSGRRQANDWQLFKSILPYASPYRNPVGLAALLLIPLALAGALQPLLVGQAISLLRGEDSAYDFLKAIPLGTGLNVLSGLLLVTVVTRFSLQAVQGFWVQKVGQQITADIRRDLFAHVLSLSVRFFDRTPVGKLITRLTSDVEALGNVFATGAVGIISDIFSILVIVVTMFLTQWQLALVLVLLLIPIAALILYFQYEYRRANYRAREELAELNATLQENMMGISVVQMFRRERFNSELFRQSNLNYVHEVDRTIFFDSAVSATLEWVAFAAIAGILWFGGKGLLNETLTLGTLSTFILFAQRLFNPLQQLAEKFTSIQAGLTAIERIYDLLSEPVEIRDAPETQTLSTDEADHLGEIQFQNVWFAYKDDDYVLRDLSFTLRPGEKVAIVGPTGAGKSSIIRLLCRLYEPSQGRIIVDGVDVRNLSQSELRRHVGVILQNGFLFAGDVKSNIALGESYCLSQIQEAAERVNVDGFIRELPEGYDTQLRQRGTNLSAGQKQLLAFARASIRNPNILVLDEATANLDVGTEVVIQDALEKLLAQRTAIIIAHRLSTIRNVDRILVLKQGELVEQGTHRQLLQQEGVYASLYRLQTLGVAG
ncbi:ABC transporter ATP-binding protein [Lyngbya confervoides]|uniref:ABC transporter ATP-binding protein/permease n=1 Tax=Lyngbya confervoides BDU141951 TaxID=1574623 RepID=A0ABD4TA14_9CYAN|nr:ABC transporter ATP-binding protein [Lyngbya confervoides]MCM1985357.1 ABC transporter ATP-binding protein/permease [Lyngbya confervoides BDU141951]